MTNQPPPKPNTTPIFITGVLIGVLTGGIAMLLNAPSSGRTLLRQVTGQAQTVAERVQGERIEDALNEGKAIAQRNRAQAALPTRPSDPT